jgi:ubiquinol-cytochrome c reductase cytochrome b subunit
LVSWLFWLFCYCFLSHIEINLLGDVENYLIAAPTKTPLHIKPEWYFLFAYAILRCIPSKTARVLALVASVTVFCTFTVNKSSKFLSFLCVFILLTIAGSMPVEQPYINIAQILSAVFFGLFI